MLGKVDMDNLFGNFPRSEPPFWLVSCLDVPHRLTFTRLSVVLMDMWRKGEAFGDYLSPSVLWHTSWGRDKHTTHTRRIGDMDSLVSRYLM